MRGGGPAGVRGGIVVACPGGPKGGAGRCRGGGRWGHGIETSRSIAGRPAPRISAGNLPSLADGFPTAASPLFGSNTRTVLLAPNPFTNPLSLSTPSSEADLLVGRTCMGRPRRGGHSRCMAQAQRALPGGVPGAARGIATCPRRLIRAQRMLRRARRGSGRWQSNCSCPSGKGASPSSTRDVLLWQPWRAAPKTRYCAVLLDWRRATPSATCTGQSRNVVIRVSCTPPGVAPLYRAP
jgi:hypothetical protein